MRLRSILLSSVVMVPVSAGSFGGWAVVTVENPPRALVAGAPYTLDYSVRQHGVELISGLNGSVEAVSGNRRVKADARAGKGKGRYVATLTIPEVGEWTITVHSGFGPSRTQLLPLRVAASAAVSADLPDVEYGRHLFASKGCATCHVEMKIVLDPRTQTYNAAFVKQLLSDPASVPRRHNAPVEMPNLGLKQAEIAALTAYLAGPNGAGTR